MKALYNTYIVGAVSVRIRGGPAIRKRGAVRVLRKMLCPAIACVLILLCTGALADDDQCLPWYGVTWEDATGWIPGEDVVLKWSTLY